MKMRYTTIIDISEYRDLYRNIHVRLVYLHMCLKAGYHDSDRDWVKVSVRSLAADVGISVGAVRHALQQLVKYKLIAPKSGLYYVRKFIVEQPITARAATAKQAKQQRSVQARADEQQQLDKQLDQQRRQRKQLEQQGKSPWMAYYEYKQQQAAAGDQEAAQWVAANKAEYERQRQVIANKE